MFKHELGSKARSKTTLFVGVIVSRSQALYGCNRYYLQAQAGKDNKLPDSYWFDEDDLDILEKPKVKKSDKNTGGPISRVR